jgi:nitroreductase
MDVLEAIRTRRSVKQFRPERPPRHLIERVIEAATYAPTHHLTEPWRFFVLAGRAREEFGTVLAEALRARLDDPESAVSRELLAKERARPLRAPVNIVVAVEPQRGPKIVEIEEVEAGAAAVQNLLLAAHALGLATKWTTGRAAYDPLVKAFFGLGPEAHIVGIVYVGYPAAAPAPVPRRPAAEKTVWLDWPAGAE